MPTEPALARKTLWENHRSFSLFSENASGNRLLIVVDKVLNTNFKRSAINLLKITRFLTSRFLFF